MRIGDEVVIMSAQGRFTIVAIEGPVLTLENRNGIRKTVHVTNVRTMPKPAEDASQTS